MFAIAFTVSLAAAVVCSVISYGLGTGWLETTISAVVAAATGFAAVLTLLALTDRAELDTDFEAELIDETGTPDFGTRFQPGT